MPLTTRPPNPWLATCYSPNTLTQRDLKAPSHVITRVAGSQTGHTCKVILGPWKWPSSYEKS